MSSNLSINIVLQIVVNVVITTLVAQLVEELSLAALFGGTAIIANLSKVKFAGLNLSVFS